MPVGEGDELGAVGHDDDGAALAEGDEELVDGRGSTGVEVGGGLVDEEDGCRRQGGPGQGDAGPLSGREAEPVVAEGRREGVREGGDEPLEADLAQGLPERVVGGVVAEGQRVAQGPGGEEGTLGDEVAPAGLDRTTVGGAQPGDELEDRGLADTRRPGERGQTRAPP